jgi:hypothetical protein
MEIPLSPTSLSFLTVIEKEDDKMATCFYMSGISILLASQSDLLVTVHCASPPLACASKSVHLAHGFSCYTI